MTCVVRSPLVVTYHCDVSPGPGAAADAVRAAVDTSSRIALRRADRVIVTSDDYARHSRLWPAMAGRAARAGALIYEGTRGRFIVR